MTKNQPNKITKPPVISSQFSLPFRQLDPMRFEDLILRLAILEYGLKEPEHLGRAGSEGGIDIKGVVMRMEEKIPMTIQVKRCEKISGKDLINALNKFTKNYTDFNGEFWIITCATVSKKARDQFAKVADNKKVNYRIVDGSVLEVDIKKFPDLLEDFFSVPKSPLKDIFLQSATKIKKRLQKFEDEFLYELNRSFAGNIDLIFERQRVMYQIVNEAMVEIRSELTILDNHYSLSDVEKAAKDLISNYRSGNQTAEGSLFYGKEVGIKALSEQNDKRGKFLHVCESLHVYLKQYLLS